MADIQLDNVSVAFPVYDNSSRSLKSVWWGRRRAGVFGARPGHRWSKP